MTGKRSKLTADKARERITILEESIALREQKLDHLRAKLSRTPDPEEKLLRVEERLAKRLELEQDQLAKLRRLLSRQSQSSLHDSAEYYSNEELDDLHRSFEEVRQDLSQVKMRLENTEVPRDLPTRINAFEERLSRREEADTGVFTQLMSLQAALDQERETVRKLSRRVREQEQSLEALREAVEDSVVATVDLAERLDEMDDSMGEQGTGAEAYSDPKEQVDLEAMRAEFRRELEALEQRYLEQISQLPAQGQPASADDSQLELVLEAIQDFDARLEEVEASLEALPARALEAEPEQVYQPPTEPSQEPAQDAAPASLIVAPVDLASGAAAIRPILVETATSRVPARFAGSSGAGRVVAKFAGGSKQGLS